MYVILGDEIFIALTLDALNVARNLHTTCQVIYSITSWI